MSSSFFEINIAMSGLYAAQRGMAVTGNNVTNAATPGYSRQILEQRASSPLNGLGTGMIGTGVETTQIRRVRDSYLDQKLWGQNDTLGEYRVKSQQNALVESVFGEPSDVGFTTLFGDVFAALDDLSKLPSEGERKEALRQTLISFTKYFNTASETLSNYQKDLNFEIKAKVEEINMLSERIQSLNKQIYQQEMHGDIANTLRDERDLCVDKLSQLINIEAKEVEITKSDGTKELQFQVKANGQTLVDHFQVNLLTVEVRKEGMHPEDVDGLFDIKWENGMPFDMSDSKLSGELKGLIDMRDGRGVEQEGEKEEAFRYKGIPYYIKKMDQFATGFAEAMNKVYNQEIGADGKPVQAIGGTVDLKDENGEKIGELNIPKYILFGATPEGEANPTTDITKFLKKDENGNFVDKDGDGFADLDIKASEFSVSAEVFKGSENIRTNFEHKPPESNPNEGSNDLLLELLGQKDNKHMFKEGDPKDFMISMFSELGISTREANMYEKSQTNITKVINNQRLSVSQVDTNEEFMNLLKYNQAYQVAAKLISTMDGIYETTIHKLGNW